MLTKINLFSYFFLPKKKKAKKMPTMDIVYKLRLQPSGPGEALQNIEKVSQSLLLTDYLKRSSHLVHFAMGMC